EILFSDVLSHLAGQGCAVSIAIRRVPENDRFLYALEADVRSGLVAITFEPELHEKTLAGDDYVLSGSMNFTYSGLELNEEYVRLDVDPSVVALTRQQLRSRWGPS